MKLHRWEERTDDAGKMTRKDICADCGAVRVRRWVPPGAPLHPRKRAHTGNYRVVGYALNATAVMVGKAPMCSKGTAG